MKILNIVGARPNFMKVAPLHRAFQRHSQLESRIVHTGQHYDAKMSDVFFNQLELPRPHYYLGVGSGSHAQQTAKVMVEFERVVEEERPDLVLVVGDVNSTIACALVASKLQIPVAHVEAGLRSGDRAMPEEINRVLTDRISDYLFVTEQSGMVQLAREGAPPERIFFTGNVMIDSLAYYRERSKQVELASIMQHVSNAPVSANGHEQPPASSLQPKAYILMTMHRPSNVDDEQGLRNILTIIQDATRHHPVVFAIHPRTEKSYRKYGLYEELAHTDNLFLLPPQGYLEFLKLMDNAALIITDSGGIQEETTYLRVPCMTFRSTTERPVTVELGTNFLMADLDPGKVGAQLERIVKGEAKQGVVPPLWDGRAAERIAEVLVEPLRALS